MRRDTFWYVASWPVMLSLLCKFCTAAPSPVTITVNPKEPGRAVPADFCGLSYEIKLVLPDPNGRHYFSPTNQPLISAFKTLGIKHLRVGGNTADRATVAIPNTSDIDELFGFAKAAGVKVIYTVRMNNGDPQDAARIVKYLMDHYKDYVSCITVGNEPDMFAKPYSTYKDLWLKYVSAITAPEYAPNAKFCGPSTTPGGVSYVRDFANDMAKSGRIAMITQHDYPGKAARNATDADAGRAMMLSAEWHQVYQKVYDSFVPAVLANGLTYRLEEANSFYNGGALGASDTFTSALWVLDYLYWWASHDAAGINFHTGQKVTPPGTTEVKPNVYTALTSSPSGVTVYPIAYGMKAFAAGSHGKLLPVTITSHADPINLVAYGVLAADGRLCLTLINKEYGPQGRAADVTIETGLRNTPADLMLLTSPGGDVAAIQGVSFGGAAFKADGSWDGKWTATEPSSDQGRLAIQLPAATAAVLKLQPK